MSLHYVIDGYNLLYALPDIPPGTWEKKRLALLARISGEKPHGKNRMTVVFDSREGTGSESRQEDMAIVYTAGETADDWIAAYVRRAANPRIIIVVTNDQGLRRLVRGTGAKSFGTEEFWRLAHTPIKPRPEQRTEIDTDSITEEFKKKWT